MRRALLISTAALLAAGALGPARAQTLTLAVDCAGGQTISHALTQGDPRKPLVVVVSGTCNELVTVARDDVTLRGVPGVGATVNGPGSTEPVIYVLGRRATIENLTLMGGRFGILVQSALGTMVQDCTIRNTSGDGIRVVVGELDVNTSVVQDTGGNGIAAFRGATLRVIDGQILRNRLSGIRGDQNATVTATGNTIANNGSNGVEFTNDSYGSIGTNTITGNGTIPGRPGHGVFVSASQAVVSGSPDDPNDTPISDNRDGGVLSRAGSNVTINRTVISGSRGIGVHGMQGSTILINGSMISGHDVGILCVFDCALELVSTTVRDSASDGINVGSGSKLRFVAPISHSINNRDFGVFCDDAASSLFGTSNLDGTMSPGCVVY